MCVHTITTNTLLVTNRPLIGREVCVSLCMFWVYTSVYARVYNFTLFSNFQPRKISMEVLQLVPDTLPIHWFQ